MTLRKKVLLFVLASLFVVAVAVALGSLHAEKGTIDVVVLDSYWVEGDNKNWGPREMLLKTPSGKIMRIQRADFDRDDGHRGYISEDSWGTYVALQPGQTAMLTHKLVYLRFGDRIYAVSHYDTLRQKQSKE